MLTENQIRSIQKENKVWTQKFIIECDQKWDDAIRTLKGCGKDLTKIRIVTDK